MLVFCRSISCSCLLLISRRGFDLSLWIGWVPQSRLCLQMLIVFLSSFYRASYIHIFFICLSEWQGDVEYNSKINKSRLKTDGIEINCPGLMAKYLKMLLTSLLFLATGILQPLLRVNCFSPFGSTKSQSTNIGSLQWNKSHISDLRQNFYISDFR